MNSTQSLEQAPQGSHHGTKPVKSSRIIWKMLLVMWFSFRQSCDRQGVGSLWFLSKLKYSMILWVWYCYGGPQWNRSRAMCCIIEPLCHQGIIPVWAGWYIPHLQCRGRAAEANSSLYVKHWTAVPHVPLSLAGCLFSAGCREIVLITLNWRERVAQFLFMQADRGQVLQQEGLPPLCLFFFVLCSIKPGNLKRGWWGSWS